VEDNMAERDKDRTASARTLRDALGRTAAEINEIVGPVAAEINEIVGPVTDLGKQLGFSDQRLAQTSISIGATVGRVWESVLDATSPATRRDAERPSDFSTFAAALTETITSCVTLGTLFDDTVASDTFEHVLVGLCWLPSPAFPKPAEDEWEAQRRRPALQLAVAEGKVPQPRLRIGQQVLDCNRAAMTLEPSKRDQWVWQKAKNIHAGDHRQGVRPATPRWLPLDVPSGEATTGTEELLAPAGDEKGAEKIVSLLGDAVMEVMDKLSREDRDRVQAAFEARLPRQR
jgi:hypothetical protein